MEVPRAIRLAVRSGRRLLRDALVASFLDESRITVVGHVCTADDLLALCALFPPDVIVYDLGDDRVEELHALRTLRHRHPDSRLIVLYDRAARPDLLTVWETHPYAVVPHSLGLEALIVTLTRDSQITAGAAGDGHPTHALTDLERDIVTMVGAGHTATRIAMLFDLSTNAVINAKRRIYDKLGVTCQSQAVARIADLGLAQRTLEWRVPADRGSHTRLIVVLRGPAGPGRRTVVTTLLRHRIALVIGTPEDALLNPHLYRAAYGDRAGAGRTVSVLVAPDTVEWADGSGLDDPVILVHTSSLTTAQSIDAVSRGVKATLPVECVAEELVPLVMFTLRGCQSFEQFTDPAPSPPHPYLFQSATVPLLTSRENDILRSIAAGHTVRQTARSLGIAVKTVENIQARLLRKLNAKNRAGALIAAHELGLIEQLTDRSFVIS
jgi:DNA-binding NarL/FixJ family response regulator